MNKDVKSRTSDKQAETPDDGSKQCPDCGHEMMMGQMSDGRDAWGCTNFQTCRRIDLVYTPEEREILDSLRRLAREDKITVNKGVAPEHIKRSSGNVL